MCTMADFDRLLRPTFFIDYDHPAVISYAREQIDGVTDPTEQAIRLYYAVRDDFRYDPYRISLLRQDMKASACLERGYGFCIPKATLLAAVARGVGIPARLGFADVKNHLATKRLRDLIGMDLFAWHGFTELHLNGQWVKATPAFNLSLCERFGVLPLEFDGTEDSIFHPFDADGRLHMEYVADRGSFDDLPFDDISHDFKTLYPRWGTYEEDFDGDFEAEAAVEYQANR